MYDILKPIIVSSILLKLTLSGFGCNIKLINFILALKVIKQVKIKINRNNELKLSIIIIFSYINYFFS
jgi:hypothetical protein